MESGPANRQPSLFEDCASRCEAYHACGGGYAAAPCGCAWKPGPTSRRHQCATCYLVCRERTAPHPLGGHADAFGEHVAAGLPLARLHLAQELPPFPLLLPTKTDALAAGGACLPLRWAAVDVKSLLNWRHRAGAALKPAFADAWRAREALRVGPECELVAVFNAQDKILESFWAMPRRAALRQLRACAVAAVTGPTFSVSTLTTAGTPTPRAHNVAMQLRHHRVLAEAQEAGLQAIPNLYWEDAREQRAWVDWLRAHPEVAAVSRDFTRTRSRREFDAKLDGLLALLTAVGRPLHVLVVGAGPAHAPAALFRLAEAGLSGSVVTSDPLLKASHGQRYERNAIGRLTQASCPSASISQLSFHNLRLFEELLFETIAHTHMATLAQRNLRPMDRLEALQADATSGLSVNKAA